MQLRELLEAMPVCKSTAKKTDRCMPMEPTSSAQNAKNDNNTKTNTLQNNDLSNDMCCFMLSCNGCVLGGTTCASKADGLSMPPPSTLRSHASHERLGRHAVADVTCSLKPSHPPQGCEIPQLVQGIDVLSCSSRGFRCAPYSMFKYCFGWGLGRRLQFAGAWTPVGLSRGCSDELVGQAADRLLCGVGTNTFVDCPQCLDSHRASDSRFFVTVSAGLHLGACGCVLASPEEGKDNRKDQGQALPEQCIIVAGDQYEFKCH